MNVAVVLNWRKRSGAENNGAQDTQGGTCPYRDRPEDEMYEESLDAPLAFSMAAEKLIKYVHRTI
jgi:hypothetical protein